MKANVNRARAKEEALQKHFAQPGVDSVLVSVDFSRGVDSSVIDVENNLWLGEIANCAVADDVLRGVWETLVMKVDRRDDSKELHEIINKHIEEKKAEKTEGENDVSDPV